VSHPNRLPLAVAIVGILAATPASALASERGLGDWQAYALATITPDYDWAESTVSVRAPTVFDERSVLPGNGRDYTLLRIDGGSSVGLEVDQRLVGTSVAGMFGRGTALRSGTGIERTTLAPSLSRSVGDDGVLTAAVILASQQFATWGFGSGTRSLVQSGSVPSAISDVSYGSGVRVSMAQPLSASVDVVSAFQSRIDMDAFKNYRGLYSEPGDFDLPAIASVGLQWRAGDAYTLGLGVSRIGYGDVAPFTSSALPSSLLALIGDGTSPAFVWRDLTVVSADWAWRPTAATELTLRYSTQQQPEPTSNLLSSALAERYSDRNFSVSLLQGYGAGASFELHASYAPVPYFLGNTSYAERDSTGDQFEVEAFWSVPF
jgi:hypothetical protein